MRELLARAEQLAAARGLSAEHRRAIADAVRGVRRAAATLRGYREDELSRGTVMAGVGTTAGAVVADDVTVVGVADNVLLVPCAVAALAALVIYPPTGRTTRSTCGTRRSTTTSEPRSPSIHSRPRAAFRSYSRSRMTGCFAPSRMFPR